MNDPKKDQINTPEHERTGQNNPGNPGQNKPNQGEPDRARTPNEDQKDPSRQNPQMDPKHIQER